MPRNRNPIRTIDYFPDKEIQSRGDLLDIPLGLEISTIHQEVADQSISTSLFNFAQDQVVKFTEDKLTREQANELYGQPGLVEFDKPIYPTVAKRIRLNKIQQAQRQAILAQDAFDNNVVQVAAMGASAIGTAVALDPFFLLSIATGIGGVVAGSTLAGASVSAKTRNFVSVMDALSKAPGARTATKVFNGIHKATSVEKLGAFGSGFVRASGAVALEQLATEPFVYRNAKQNGYDYDVLQSLMFGFGATGAVGAIGGSLSKALIKGGRKAINEIIQSPVDVVAAQFDHFDLSLRKGYVSEQIFEQLIVKTHADIAVGRPVDLDFIRAAVRLDNSGRQTKRFYDRLRSGEFDDIFSPAQKNEIFNLGNIDNAFIGSTNFKKWVNNTGAFAGDLVRATDSIDLAKDLDLVGASLSKIDARLLSKNKVADALAKKIQDLTDNIELLKAEVDLKTGAKRAKIERKLQSLLQERQGSIEDLNKLQDEVTSTNTLKQLVMNDELESYFNNARSLRSVTDMTFDEFKSEFKDLSKSLKAKKIPKVGNFSKLHDTTKSQIARLFHLSNREDIYGLDIKDLLQTSDSEFDLLEAYHKHLTKSQIEEMPIDEAAEVVKRTINDADDPIVKKMDEILRKDEPLQGLDTDADIAADIEIKKKQLSPEDLKEYDEIDKSTDVDLVNKENALSEVIKCRAGAGL